MSNSTTSSIVAVSPSQIDATDNSPTPIVKRTHDQHSPDASVCDANDNNNTNDTTVDIYYETQPRSLAALAERDRRREQLYLQRLAKKEQQQQTTKSNSVNNNSKDQQQQPHRTLGVEDGMSTHTSSIDSSRAMIVNECRVSSRNNNADANCKQTVDVVDFQLSANSSSPSSSPNKSNNELQQQQQQPLQRPRIITSFKHHSKNTEQNSAVNNNNNNSGAIGDSKNRNNKMEKSKVSAVSVPVSVATMQATSKNNNDMLPPKSIVDSKKQNNNQNINQKAGFLSRFTNFRFSLRGANKKKLKSIENTAPPSSAAANIVLVSTKTTTPPSNGSTAAAVSQVPMRNKTNQQNNNNNSRAGCYQRNSMRSNEFEYIPLKDPVAVVFDATNQSSDKSVNCSAQNNQTNQNYSAAATVATTPNNNTSKMRNVTGKPPLPRQPPRVVSVCAKQSSPSPLNATHPSYQHPARTPATINNIQQTPTGEIRRHAHHNVREQRSTSAPREINFSTADTMGKQQPNFQQHYLANSRDYDDVDYQLLSSRQPNDTINSRNGVGYLKSAVSSDGLLMDNPNDSVFSHCEEDEGDEHVGNITDSKIGLIETNLDTDETIISGKTRSLMELGPQYTGRSSASAAIRRLGKHNVNGTSNTSNIEPRRPHKSMEFLLDKENQRFVLVSSKPHTSFIFLAAPKNLPNEFCIRL